MRTVYFRADASSSIGYGHFYRTLALADMIDKDFKKVFVTCKPSAFQIELIKDVCDEYIEYVETHFEEFLSVLKCGDIVVLDNYYFSTNYQNKIKQLGCYLVCFDDLHDKHYVADVVINHALNNPELFSIEKYTHLCLGLEWAVLRKPFLMDKPIISRTKGHCVVAFGGVDKFNLSCKIAKILSLNLGIHTITVVIGDAYENEGTLREIPKVQLRKNLTAHEIRDLFCSVEFAVLPTSTICIEALSCNCPVFGGYYVDNQIEFYNYLTIVDGLYKGLKDFKDIRSEIFTVNTKKSYQINTYNIIESYNRIFKSFI